MQFLLSNRILFCLFFLLSLMCNKYVLTTLGFQYPTIFQAWQTFVSLFLSYSQNVLDHATRKAVEVTEEKPDSTTEKGQSNMLKSITIPQIFSWLPAMFFNVGALCAGSISLGRLPIPAFLASYAASDAVLLLFDSHLPSGLLQMSLSVKLITMMLIVWYSSINIIAPVVNWICAYTIFHGLQKCVLFWYSQPSWPQASLNRSERQFLNDLFAVSVLAVVAVFYGHHQDVYDEYPHLNRSVFYLCCVLSGLFGWLTRMQLNVLKMSDSKMQTEMTQLLAKVVTMLAAMQVHDYPDTIMLWLCIISSVGGDILYILGNAVDESSDFTLRNILIDS